MVDETGETKTVEKKTNVYAAIGIGFVCVVVGLPLWWKTTEVYRVSLPYSDIETLADAKVEYAVDLNVVSFVEKVTSNDLATLSKHLMEQLDAKPDARVKSRYRTVVREAKEGEISLLKAAASISDLDKKLAAALPDVPNTYNVVLLPAGGRVSVDKPTLGLHRNSFISHTGQDMTSFSAEIVQYVKFTLVRESTVIKGFKSAKGTRDLKPDKETLRSLRSSPGYDVTLTLVSPRPDITDPQWDIEGAVQTYLKPFLSKLEEYVTVNIKSQVLFFTKLQVKPRRQGDEFFFTSQDLPHMINPLEAKLISPASTKPELNFIVYVPSKDQYPLYIHDEQGGKVASNSFLSPQWGGIQIYNMAPPAKNASLPSRPQIDMRQVMEVILSQLRLLLNLQTQVVDNVDFLPVGRSAITDWELDSWLRSRCVENLATSTASLKSLAELLGKISNIVINDDIGEESQYDVTCENLPYGGTNSVLLDQLFLAHLAHSAKVHTAVESVPKSLQNLASGSLVSAFIESRKAIVASEKAFFDPSLLELLYFPEDQKFAIYIPLFLPISFPVLASLYQAYKWYRGIDKPKQE